MADPSSNSTDDGFSDDDRVRPGRGRDMAGASRQEVADFVDELEERALAEAGHPHRKIADAARAGTDRAAEDVEPPV